MEEEYIQQLCEDIIHLKPDVVITEKGISGGPCALSSGEKRVGGGAETAEETWCSVYTEGKTGTEPRGSACLTDTAALGFADLAQHYLMRANITAIRRVRKTDNNRIAR